MSTLSTVGSTERVLLYRCVLQECAHKQLEGATWHAGDVFLRQSIVLLVAKPSKQSDLPTAEMFLV